MSFDQKS